MKIALAFGLVVALPGWASAADVASHAPPPPAPAASNFDIAFGVSATTDFISRGITQTNHGPALQGYVELAIADFYANFWASNVALAGDTLETDWTLGWRPTFGPLSFDFGYARYVLFPTGWAGSSGEAFAKVSFSPVEPLTLGAEFYINPADTATYVEANAEYALPYDLAASGAIGVSNSGGASYVSWNAGISWTWKETVTLDLRYWDTNLSPADCAANWDANGYANGCDARIVATVSLDTSLKNLGILK